MSKMFQVCPKCFKFVQKCQNQSQNVQNQSKNIYKLLEINSKSYLAKNTGFTSKSYCWSLDLMVQCTQVLQQFAALVLTQVELLKWKCVAISHRKFSIWCASHISGIRRGNKSELLDCKKEMIKKYLHNSHTGTTNIDKLFNIVINQ